MTKEKMKYKLKCINTAEIILQLCLGFMLSWVFFLKDLIFPGTYITGRPAQDDSILMSGFIPSVIILLITLGIIAVYKNDINQELKSNRCDNSFHWLLAKINKSVRHCKSCGIPLDKYREIKQKN